MAQTLQPDTKNIVTLKRMPTHLPPGWLVDDISLPRRSGFQLSLSIWGWCDTVCKRKFRYVLIVNILTNMIHVCIYLYTYMYVIYFIIGEKIIRLFDIPMLLQSPLLAIIPIIGYIWRIMPA
jgi:hypothetical protein